MTDSFEDHLRMLLSKIPAMKERDSRDMLLRNLPKGPVLAIPRSDIPLVDFNNIISAAIDLKWILAKRKWALDIIIDNAKLFVTGTELEEELKRLQAEFRELLGQIRIQVAVIAMTQDEAKALQTEAVFEQSMVPRGERKYLRDMKNLLQQYNVEDFTRCYDEMSRDHWIPLSLKGTPISIQEIIQDVVQRLNKRPGKPAIYLQYVSSNFLSADHDERCRTWDVLEEQGGILIVDALSMYHPALRCNFINSQLIGLKNRIGIIVISPLNTPQINELLENQIYGSHLERAFHYFAEHLHPLYQFGVGDLKNLTRWLYQALQNLERDEAALSQQTLEAIQAERNHAPQGIRDYVIGRARP